MSTRKSIRFWSARKWKPFKATTPCPMRHAIHRTISCTNTNAHIIQFNSHSTQHNNDNNNNGRTVCGRHEFSLPFLTPNKKWNRNKRKRKQNKGERPIFTLVFVNRWTIVYAIRLYVAACSAQNVFYILVVCVILVLRHNSTTVKTKLRMDKNSRFQKYGGKLGVSVCSNWTSVWIWRYVWWIVRIRSGNVNAFRS